ncbi:hypothetical protein [Fuerstiella marisgermanici]|uniref:Uncharacterized protein n=1 Tax=Fuerstiella marisgermanici TaxID=1891926 RepID=A0A1P8WLI9_9PLAN|nr:hypothetical protein [Fuerstiella marisgermanici]APZ94915.1 hypothetical protein Fuma_04566 [Fuerstiella marisgermanici]
MSSYASRIVWRTFLPILAAILCTNPKWAVAQSLEADQRRNRLSIYCDAMQSWLTDVAGLSDEQENLIQQHLRARVEESQRVWQPKPRNRPLSDAGPIRFTMSKGAAKDVKLKVDDKELRSILSTAQLDKLSKELRARKVAHANATIGHAVNVLDDELFLTNEQRRAVAEYYRKSTDSEFAAYSLFPSDRYYKQLSPIELLAKPDWPNILSTAQQQRATDFVEATKKSLSINTEMQMSFEPAASVADWLENLNKYGKEQHRRVQRALKVRAEYWSHEWHLPDDSAKKLLVASKGVADQLVATWKTKARAHLEQLELEPERVIATSMSMPVVNLRTVDDVELWKHTLKSVKPKGETFEYDRIAEIRRTTSEYLTICFDRELWLTSTQRNRLQQKIEKLLPPYQVHAPQNVALDELALLVIPLFRLTQQDLELLTENQQKAFDLLKSQFRVTNGVPYIHLKNDHTRRFYLHTTP